MGFKDKKKEHNKVKNKEKKEDVLNVGGEDVKSISYFQLFRYANGRDKLMIFIGIFGALMQGATLPFMINSMGDMTNIFISLVVNTTLKKITGIQNEDALMDLIKMKTSNDFSQIASFEQKYKIDINKLLEKFKNSEYKDFDFNSSQ
jgi:hypothetical protein